MDPKTLLLALSFDLSFGATLCRLVYLAVDAGVQPRHAGLHPQEASHPQLLGVRGDVLAETVVVLLWLAGDEAGRGRGRGAGSLHFYPRQ